MLLIDYQTICYNSFFPHHSESESSLEIDFDERHQSINSDSGVPIPSQSSSGASTSSSTHRQRTLSSPVPMNVAMSPPASKAPPPTPLAISSPISQEHLMPRPISPISRQKTVCCPKCSHFFLASIGSYTNLFANANIANSTNSLLNLPINNNTSNSSSSSLSGNNNININNIGQMPLLHHSPQLSHNLSHPQSSSSNLMMGGRGSIGGSLGGSSGSMPSPYTMYDQAMQEDNLSNSSSNSNSQSNLASGVVKQQSIDSDQMGTD